MRKQITKNNKIIIAIIIGIGLAGVILFFPVKLNSQYTCLFHRLIADHFEKKVSPLNTPDAWNGSTDSSYLGYLTENENSANRFGLEDSVKDDSGLFTKEGDNGIHRLLFNHYIKTYAVFWWGSIVLLAVGGYLFRKLWMYPLL